jgi:Glycosyl hydrolase family 26
MHQASNIGRHWAPRRVWHLSSVLLAAAIVASSFMNTGAAQAAAGDSAYWGAYISGAPDNTALIDSFEAKTGKKMSIVHWGEPWLHGTTYQPFPTTYMQRVRDRGSMPMLNWGSWDYSLGPTQPNFRLANIANGTYDSFITQWARDAKTWGHPFFLRFDHEMNGYWQFPWAEQINGNQPGDYVKAWRHVHDIFSSVGATNATWVWCPNISGPSTTTLAELYPGDGYVDWTAMDGYNWGTDQGNVWQSFAQVFGGADFGGYNSHNTYQELLSFAPSKPIMIGETASSENGGDKASWITDMLKTQLPTNFPKIKAVVWFDWNADDPTISWPIESSAAAQTAFANGISSSYYTSNTFGSLAAGVIAPPSSTVAVADPVVAVSTLTVTPVADTYTASSSPSSTAGGTAPELRADMAGTDTAFLRFSLSQLAGKTITSAALRLHSASEAWAGSAVTFDVKLVPANDWKEQWMSFTNTVPIASTVLGTLVAPRSPNTWYQVGLSSSVLQSHAGGLISMAITGRASDVLIFNSRESGSLAPRLILTYR